MHEEEEHQGRIEAMIGGTIKGIIKYEVEIGKKAVLMETKLTADKARATPHTHEHAHTRTNARTHERARASNSQVQHFEYCLEPQKLEKWRGAVRAEWDRIEASKALQEAEKKRKRAELKAKLPECDVDDAKLESSQSYEEEEEPATEKTDENEAPPAPGPSAHG